MWAPTLFIHSHVVISDNQAIRWKYVWFYMFKKCRHFIRFICDAPVCTSVSLHPDIHYHLGCQNRGSRGVDRISLFLPGGFRGSKVPLFNALYVPLSLANYTLFVPLCAFLYGSTHPSSRPPDNPNYYMFSTYVILLTSSISGQSELSDTWCLTGVGVY